MRYIIIITVALLAHAAVSSYFEARETITQAAGNPWHSQQRHNF